MLLQTGDKAFTVMAHSWRSLMARTATVSTPGKHMDILDPPNVDILASSVHAAKSRLFNTL
jgi:thioesterase domain-containing protein